MFDGLLSAGHGRAILSIPDEEARIRLAQKVVDEHLSVRETENLAKFYGSGNLERSKRPVSPRAYKKVAQKLRLLLATTVKVKTVRGKNRIEIEFKDEEELERIFLFIENSSSSKPASTNNKSYDELSTKL
jgi:ParB family chromosome partitioning protein